MKSIILVLVAVLLIVFGSIPANASGVVEVTLTIEADTVVFTPPGPIIFHVGDELHVRNQSGATIRVERISAQGAVLFAHDVSTGITVGLPLLEGSSTDHICVTYPVTNKGPVSYKCVGFALRVPTLTEWGVTALIVILIGAGVTVAFRKRPAGTA